MKKIIWAMLFVIAILLVIPLISCKEQHEATPMPSIDGRWQDLTGTLNPEWHYHFDRGLLLQSYEDFGATLTTLTYPYATRHDSVFIGGDATNAPRVWVLEFECADVVKVRNVGQVLGATFWLKRE